MFIAAIASQGGVITGITTYDLNGDPVVLGDCPKIETDFIPTCYSTDGGVTSLTDGTACWKKEIATDGTITVTLESIHDSTGAEVPGATIASCPQIDFVAVEC